MPAEYPVRTLAEIARIPEEAFPRFIAEFPLLVATMRAHVEMMEQLHDLAGMDKPSDEQVFQSMEGVKWIDDDKGNVSVSIDVEDKDGERSNLVCIKANHKTHEFSGKLGDFFASGIEARSDAIGTGAAEGESPTAESGDAQ